MLDALYAAMPREPWRGAGLARAARGRRARPTARCYAAHPWAARVSTARPPLGPGLMAKYEHELAALDGAGLDDVELDAALTFLLAFVQGAAAAAQDAAAAPGHATRSGGRRPARCSRAPSTPSATRSPRASAPPPARRRARAYDPERAYAFGLERVLDGLAALIDDR